MEYLLTFDSLMIFLRDFYENPYEFKRLFLFMVIYQVYSILLIIRYIFYILFSNNIQTQENWWNHYDVFVYFFAAKIMQDNKLLVACCIFMTTYACLIVHYQFFHFYRNEQCGVNDILRLIAILHKKELNWKFLAKNSIKNIKHQFFLLSNQISVQSTPYLSRLGRYRYITEYVITQYIFNILAVFSCKFL